MSKKGSGEVPETPHYRVSVLLHRDVPQVYSLVARESADFVSVSIRQRGEGDFVSVLKRVGPDGGAEVLFGNGYDFVSALLALEGSCAGNRWMVDKPWKPGG